MKKWFVALLLFAVLAGLCISASAGTISAPVLVNSVKQWEGTTGYGGWCLLWVHDALVATGAFDGNYSINPHRSAQEYWNGLIAGGRAHSSPKNPENIPLGADVFFSSPDGNGHVGIYVGNGKFISADDKVAIYPFWNEPITYGNYWGNSYYGWAWHDGITVTDSGADTTAPVITNVKVSDLSSSGYTVTCNVSDNVGVQRVAFPTWTEQNGQDDIKWMDGSLNNGVATFRVNVSDHNNERNCRYITHIYAYDYYENNTSVGVSPFVPANQGSPMTSLSERILPDGDYIIASASSQSKSTLVYLDVVGVNSSWTYDDTNVATCLSSDGAVPATDVWTISYDSSRKYYRIKQKATNMALSIELSDPLSEGANVLAHEYQEADCQYWKISTGSGNGYLVQAYCSGFALQARSGGNAAQGGVGNADDTSWLFIPYNPSLPVGVGRYVILSGNDNSFELDVDTQNGDNIRMWKDTVSSNKNAYDFTFYDNGYYKIKNVLTGKCLEVAGGLSTNGSNVRLWEDNGSIAQQWALIRNGSNYLFVSRCNGYALSFAGTSATNGANVSTNFRDSSTKQNWTLVTAEHTIAFDLNGGYDGPSDQIKYYNTDLVLSPIVPKKDGFAFVRWEASKYGDTITFQPGDTIDFDTDITLTAIWTKGNYTITYDANGGTGAPESQNVNGGTTTLSSETPVWDGHDFLGWSVSATSTSAEYQPGDSYPGGTITLYAIWSIKQYTVTFNSDGAGNYDPRVINHGEMLGELPEPHKDAIFFIGWYDGTGSKVSSETIVKSSLVLTARWSNPTKMILPSSLTSIDEEAFVSVNTNSFIVPANVSSIGSKAFANNSNLYTVIIYSKSVTPASDAFANCPNLTIYGYADTPIQYYATAKKIPFIALDAISDWMSYSELPIGATITDEKWTYTEIAESTSSSMAGWTQNGASWRETSSGISKYVEFPSGFNTGHTLYAKYNPANKKTANETATTKTVLGSINNAGYIYWHWTLEDRWVTDAANAGKAINVYISDKYGLDSDGYNYTRFNAFEVNDILRPVYGTNTSNNDIDLSGDGIYSTCHHAAYNLPEYVSHWWWIVEIKQQPYTISEKIFTFSRDRESTTEIQPGDGITNVQHWVKYSFD